MTSRAAASGHTAKNTRNGAEEPGGPPVLESSVGVGTPEV
jgi:hypothetical protein